VEKLTAILGLVPRHSFFALDAAFEKHNLSFACVLTQEVFASGKDPAHFLDALIDHYRILLHEKLGQPNSLFNAKEKHNYQASALLYTEEQCLYILDYLIQWQQHLSKIPFKRIFLEMLLLHILRSKYHLSAAGLVKRLIDLEHRITSPDKIIDTPASKNTPEQLSEPDNETRINPKTIQKLDEPQLQSPRVEIAQCGGGIEEIQLPHSTPQSSELSPQSPSQLLNPLGTENCSGTHPSRYETLLCFASIELEGTIKKEVKNG
jgi:DNA polymerase-3 subunit gamma/tau